MNITSKIEDNITVIFKRQRVSFREKVVIISNGLEMKKILFSMTFHLRKHKNKVLHYQAELQEALNSNLLNLLSYFCLILYTFEVCVFVMHNKKDMIFEIYENATVGVCGSFWMDFGIRG